jgi:phage shock protein C
MKDMFKKSPKKSRDDRIIDGVCAGIAKELDVAPFWVRLLSVILVPLTGGFIILVYIALMVIMDAQSNPAP